MNGDVANECKLTTKMMTIPIIITVSWIATNYMNCHKNWSMNNISHVTIVMIVTVDVTMTKIGEAKIGSKKARPEKCVNSLYGKVQQHGNM